MEILRSIGGVALGYLAMAAVVVVTSLAGVKLFPSKDGSGRPGRSYLIFNLVCGFLAAIIGGWLCGLIAGRAPMIHGYVLAALVGVLGASMAVKPRPGQPPWYPWTITAIGVAGVLIGACIRDCPWFGG